MRKNYVLSKLWRAPLCVAMVVSAVSCVDGNYDMDNLSDEATVLGGVTLPVGSTEQLYLSEFIDLESITMLGSEDGQYKFSMDSAIVEKISLSDEEFKLEVPSQSDDFEAEIGEMGDIEPFDFNIEKNTTVKLDLERVDNFSFSPISKNAELSDVDAFDYNNLIDNGIVLPAPYNETIEVAGKDLVDLANSDNAAVRAICAPLLNLDLDVDNVTIDFSISTGDNECPSEVSRVYDIEFGDYGALATIKIDMSSFSKAFSSFAVTIPCLELSLPSDFKLASSGEEGVSVSGSTVTVTDLACGNDGFAQFTFHIMGYDELSMVSGVDSEGNPVNKFADIVGDLYCKIIGVAKIETAVFSEQGTRVSEEGFRIDMQSDNIEVSDMSLDIDNLSVEFDAQEYNENYEVDVPSEIAFVRSLDLATGGNKMVMNVGSLKVPSGIMVKANGDDNLNVLLEKSLFEISAGVSDYSSEYYSVEIPKSSLIYDSQSAVQTEKELQIDRILINKEVTDGKLSIDTKIKVEGTTINLMGVGVKLSEYNAFVEQYNTQELDMSVETPSSLVVENADVVTGSIVFELNDMKSTISVSEDIPDELIDVRSFSFKNTVTAKIKVEIENLPEDAGDISFDNYVISLPKFIVFADDEDIDENNVMTLNSTFKRVDGKRVYEKVIQVNSMDFTEYGSIIEDGKVVINEESLLKGAVKIAASDISSDELPEVITGTYSFDVDDIEIGEITARIDPEMPSIEETIDLSSMTESLGEFNPVIVLSDPVLSFEVANPFDIDLEISTLNLIPLKGGNPIHPTEVECPIIIKSNATTRVVLSVDGAVGGDGDTKIKAESLSNILSVLPEKISIEVVTAVDSEKFVTVDLTKDQEVNFKYAIDIPLVFDKLSIENKSQITDLNSTILPLVENEMLKSLELILNVENSIPLSLTISEIIPIDENGDELSLEPIIKEGSNNVIEAGASSCVSTSKIVLGLKDNTVGDLKKLDGFRLKINCNANSTEGGAALREDQYLKFNLKLRLPEGINFELPLED